MSPRTRRPLLIATALAVLVGPTVASTTARAQSADKLAERLATLRAEVEELSEELTEAKTQTRNELQALARQKSDLQVELDRETIRVQKLRAQLSKKSEQLTETSEAGKKLQPVYETGLAGMRRYVASSMPFRRVERLGELDKIEEQRRQGLLTYPRALTRLWAFVEDEFRMTRESAAFQQSITVDGQDMLTDVIRVGMVMLFFKTNDGGVGYARQQGGDWQFARAQSSAEKKQIRTLFDSFKKQIRVGLFTVPAAMPGVVK